MSSAAFYLISNRIDAANSAIEDAGRMWMAIPIANQLSLVSNLRVVISDLYMTYATTQHDMLIVECLKVHRRLEHATKILSHMKSMSTTHRGYAVMN